MYGNQVFDEPAGCNFLVTFSLSLFGEGFGVFLWDGGLALVRGLMGSN